MKDNYHLNTVIAVDPGANFGVAVFQKWTDDGWYGLGFIDDPWALEQNRETWPNRFSVIWSPGDDD